MTLQSASAAIALVLTCLDLSTTLTWLFSIAVWRMLLVAIAILLLASTIPGAIPTRADRRG